MSDYELIMLLLQVMAVVIAFGALVALIFVLEKANSPSLPLGSQIKRKGHFLISIKFRDEPDVTTRLAIYLYYRDKNIYRQIEMKYIIIITTYK